MKPKKLYTWTKQRGNGKWALKARYGEMKGVVCYCDTEQDAQVMCQCLFIHGAQHHRILEGNWCRPATITAYDLLTKAQLDRLSAFWDDVAAGRTSPSNPPPYESPYRPKGAHPDRFACVVSKLPRGGYMVRAWFGRKRLPLFSGSLDACQRIAAAAQSYFDGAPSETFRLLQAVSWLPGVAGTLEKIHRFFVENNP